MEEKPTLLIFIDWYLPACKAGGPIQSVRNLASLLSPYYKVRVVCSDRDLDAAEPHPGIVCNTWTELAPGQWVMYLDHQGQSLKNIKQILKENINNIIYINGLYSFKFSVLPAFLVYWYKHSRSFIAVRGMLHRSALSVKPLKKMLFLSFARGLGIYRQSTLLSSGPSETEEIRRVLGTVAIEEVPNVPMQQAEAIKSPSGFKGEDGLVRFLFLGRIAPEKNPLGLLRALQLLEFPCHVSFYGSGNDAAYMHTFSEMLSAMPAQIQIAYREFCPHHELGQVLMAHDVMVLPSLGENFGHALFESMLHGLPVISGNNTPWKGLEALGAGIECDPLDAPALAAALERFCRMDATAYGQWSTAARKRALTYLEGNNFIERYRKLFS